MENLSKSLSLKQKLTVKLTENENELFNKLYLILDTDNGGRIEAKEAVNFMKSSGLDKNTLKKIWLTSAISSNFEIEKEEFFIALRLIALAQNNMPFSEENIEKNDPIPPLPIFRLNNNNNPNLIFEILKIEKMDYKSIYDTRKESNMERIKAREAIIFLKYNNVDDDSIRHVANLITPLEHKGFLNLKEFQIACQLINKINKMQLPQNLPLNLDNYSIGNNSGNNSKNIIDNSNNNINKDIINLDEISKQKISEKQALLNMPKEVKDEYILKEKECERLKSQYKDLKNNFDELNKKLKNEQTKNNRLITKYFHLKKSFDLLTKENNEIKDKLNNIKEKYDLLNIKMVNDKYNDDGITTLNKGEKIITINFVSMGNQDIMNYALSCKNTDIFSRIEE